MENNYQRDTQYLKDLIQKVDSTGESAWLAGEKLADIKDSKLYKEKYNSFNTYCRTEFDSSDTTINTYISIFKNFKKNDVQGLLITHLKIIANQVKSPNKRSILTKAVNSFAGDLNQGDIQVLVAYTNQNKTEKDLERDLKISLIEIKTEGENRKQFAKFGKPLTSDFLPNIKLDKEPINEMGVVGLFCLVFNGFSSYFEIDGKKMAFKKIKFIRAAFPDATVICNLNAREEVDINVEFEFQSFSYIKHKHHLAKNANDCHMIICWEDDAKTHPNRKKLTEVEKMPPVFELKNYLETGNITLIR